MTAAASPKAASPAPDTANPRVDAAVSAAISAPTELCIIAPYLAADCADERLVQACLAGNQRAWDLLVGRYKGLIYSFPRKYGADSDDAADVFQLVCADLFVALPRLRNHQSVRAWISKVAAHHAYKWKRQHVARLRRLEDAVDPCVLPTPPSRVDAEQENAQIIRNAVAQLPVRYRVVIQLLFLEEPPLPYQTVADHLGVSPGSVSFLRARGLKKLAKILYQSERVRAVTGRPA